MFDIMAQAQVWRGIDKYHDGFPCVYLFGDRPFDTWAFKVRFEKFDGGGRTRREPAGRPPFERKSRGFRGGER